MLELQRGVSLQPQHRTARLSMQTCFLMRRVCLLSAAGEQFVAWSCSNLHAISAVTHWGTPLVALFW
jgi:hypothetical protein